MGSDATIGDMVVSPPLLNGSGALDLASSDPDWNAPLAAVTPLGAYVTKTVTLRPRAGHRAPWAETFPDDRSLVNSVGLANPGVDEALAAWAALPAQVGVPVVVSVEGGDDVGELVRRCDAAGWASAIELNLSCPNVSGGLVAADATAVERAVALARSTTDLPLLAKLTPASGARAELARAAEAAGADALVAGNTMPVRAVAADGTPLLGAGPDGGLSGVAVHAINLRLVADVAAVVAIPVVGLGGVDGVAAARRMFDAGASIVGVGTGAVLDPGLPETLARWMRERQ